MKKVFLFLLGLLILENSPVQGIAETEIRCPDGDKYICYTLNQLTVYKGEGQVIIIVVL